MFVQAVPITRRGISVPLQAMMFAIATAIFVLAQGIAAQARMPDSFADLAEKVSPAVVMITTTTMVDTNNDPSPVVPKGSPFEDFFRQFRDQQGQGDRPRRAQALGSGFVISEDGYIVTNNHVIDSADEIQIEFFPVDNQPGKQLPAKVIGTDPKTDIALLKVESDEPLRFVSFGNSDDMRVGDWVMAMGNPLGQGFSVSAGIVSARNRALQGSYDDYIQTDAAINRGNSGGPLFDLDGNVIGVNTAILSPNGGSIGIGFSMASNVVDRVVGQLKKYGETRRGWLGVRIQDVNPDMVDAIDGLETARGAIVSDVPDGPAKEAGMLQGDVILSFDGVDVEDTRGLVRTVGNTEVGKTVRVKVLRDGKTETLKVTLGRREDAEAKAFPVAQKNKAEESSNLEVLGVTLSAITDQLRSDLELADDIQGLVVLNVDEASQAYEKGLRAGDLITEAGQEKLTTPAELQDKIAQTKEAGRKSLLLRVLRSGDPRFMALSLDD